MPARPMSRAAASKASLAAKAALILLAPAAIGGAILALPAIPTPHYDKPVLGQPEGQGQGQTTVRPVNLASLGDSLTLAARFPPVIELPPVTNPQDEGITPSGEGGLPAVRFLGAVAEPGRYVALLNIDGRQKFLGPGEIFRRVRVVDCNAAEVQIQIDNADGSAGPSQTIAVADREGPGWTTGGVSPSGEMPDPSPATGEQPVSMGGLPPGFVPPPGMSPQQVEQIRREFQARQDGSQRDGSQ